MVDNQGIDLVERASRAERLGKELITSGRWTSSMDEELNASFERASAEALRAAAFAERSIVLRQLARRVIPAPLRPVVLQLLKRANALRRFIGRS